MQRPRISFSLKALILLVLLLGFGFGACHYATYHVPRSLIYSLRAEFDELPADDERLHQWLSEQPGVVPNTCSVRRVGKAVRIRFLQVRTPIGRSPFPDIEAECERLGYVGRNPRFVDSRER